jgi:hypothetical protein
MKISEVLKQISEKTRRKNAIIKMDILFSPMALPPNAGHGLLILEVF